LEKQKAILEEKGELKSLTTCLELEALPRAKPAFPFIPSEFIATELRAQAASMMEENEKLKAQLREVGC